MKRLISLAGVTALAASALVTAPAATAEDGDVCLAVNGRVKLDKPIFYPHVALTLDVEFEVTAGECKATGTLDSATCGNSRGSGVLTVGTDSYEFEIVTAGGVVAVTGQVVGVFTAVPDIPGGESCFASETSPPGGADVFILNGAAVTTDEPIPPPL